MKLDRDYFKKKANPRTKKGLQLTECCNLDRDRDILNRNNKRDWLLIEEHCEDHLRIYSDVESIEPISCKKCGRLIEYKCILKQKSKKDRYKID